MARPYEPRAARDEVSSIPRDELDAEATRVAVDGCRDPAVRRELESTRDSHAVIFWHVHHPTAFGDVPCLYPTGHERAPRLDLPFRDVPGIVLPGA